jgi:GT2 family glycosyltransferase/glycosyltransferase involved in cell wall biosynthesis/SAM-dependent methyltransferase
MPNSVGELPRSRWRRRKLDVVLFADRARDAQQWELAAQLYREALDRDPGNPPIWVQYGHALKESGELRDPEKLAQAELAYRTALSLEPGAADAHLQLGHILKLQGKTEEAQAAYLRAFALDPSTPDPPEELKGLGWPEVNLFELRRILGSETTDASFPVDEGSHPAGVVPAPPEISLAAIGSLDSPAPPIYSAEQKLGVSEGTPHRVLVADYRIPMADVSAGERATVGLLADLRALGYDVTFLPNDLAPSPKYEAELQAKGVAVVTRDQGYASPTHYISRHGHTFALFYLIRLEVAEGVLQTIREVAPEARVIFHAPDLYSLREGREAELQNSEAARAKAAETRDRELTLMRQVDHVLVQSPAEVPFLEPHLPGTPISIFPALYAPITADPAPFEARRNLFFLGGFAHQPNVDAVHWFVSDIWPLVRKRLPDVEFHIVGAEAPASVRALAAIPGVKVVGFLPDLNPILNSMRVGVAPLRFGAGIKGKVTMTVGAGIPCVCTGIASEGMHLQDGVHTLVADTAQDFSDAVVRAYTDAGLWARLSADGKALISREFSSAANRASFFVVLNDARALPISLFSEYCQRQPPRPVPAPSEGAQVAVSIIVPVFNQWHYTRACLNSILQVCQSEGVTYEIILADDRSSDDTIRAAELYPGLRVVKTSSNMGFLRNCNNAARSARGQYILLLNNDTIVLPGWLSSLYSTLEQNPASAIAGSKLLYPDGNIQEAGAVLFSDGTAHNVGRGYSRDTPVFNIERETDYISGASILVRKGFWDRVGGFDERYKNAYCDDSDLAMTARSLGLRVVYQPASEVVHFEHGSYADQASSHNTELQRGNIKLLVQKWQDVFQRNHLPVLPWQIAMSNAERTAPAEAMERRRVGRLNILYFSPFPSHPVTHGNRATINQFAHHFQEIGHRVHFVLLQSNDFDRAALEAMQAVWDTVDVIPYTNPMVANGQPIPFDGWYEEGLGETVRCFCAQYDIDVVFCSYVFQSKLLEFVPSYMLKVIDTHDKMGERYEMLRANGRPLEFFSCSREEEGAYLRRADIVVARREEEARYFDGASGYKTAVTIPHVEPPSFVDRRFSRLENVGIVASANQINLAQLRECLGAIDRKLQGADCGFTVHIAGEIRNMVDRLPAGERALLEKPWMRMRGFVPNIGEFYRGMDLVLSPVIMGTGINIKTVQAMAFGMPLLTTDCGSKGIETGDPMHQHTNLDALVRSLFALAERPAELQRLAQLSRDHYRGFYDRGVGALDSLFGHPKLATIPAAVANAGLPRPASIPSIRGSRLPRIATANPSLLPLADYRHEFGSLAEWIDHRSGAMALQPATVAQVLGRLRSNGFHFHFLNEHAAPQDVSFPDEIIGLREGLVYKGLNSRLRAALHELQRHIGELPVHNAKIYAAEAISPFALLLKGRYPCFYGSEYTADEAIRRQLFPVPIEDLAALSMPDAMFDVVLTNDVFEHLSDLPRAVSEIGRVLKPGGVLISTFPFNSSSEAPIVKSRLQNGRIEHLMEPEFHGDWTGVRGSLVFEVPGWGILGQTKAARFSSAKMVLYQSEKHGVLCGYSGGIWMLVAVR